MILLYKYNNGEVAMKNNNSNDKKRMEILKKMSDIKTMRKGVISEYFVKTKLKDGRLNNNGPYYTLTSKGEKNKTVGEKIPEEKLESVKTDVDNYKLFRDLSEEYISVCEQTSIQQHNQAEFDDKLEKLKKTRSRN
jgi:hypothetical protein